MELGKQLYPTDTLHRCKTHITHYMGGWVYPRARVGKRENSCPCRESNRDTTSASP
jgi:hypothetical protein